MLQLDVQQDDLVFGAARLRQRMAQLILKLGLVDQSGQAVVRGQIVCAQLRIPDMRAIGQYGHVVLALAIFTVNAVQRQPLAARISLLGLPPALALPEPRVIQGVAHGLIKLVRMLGGLKNRHRFAHQFAHGVAGQAAVGIIGGFDHALRIGDQNGLARAVKQSGGNA